MEDYKVTVSNLVNTENKEANHGRKVTGNVDSDITNLDKILVNKVGQFGRYQARTLAMLFMYALFTGWSNNSYVFTAARIRTRCLIPECEGISNALEYAPLWILNAVPGKSQNDFENCERFANTSAPVNEEIETTKCPAILFDTRTTVLCEEYVYETTNTVTYDFGLACDEWRRTFIGFIHSVGMLVGTPLSGYISDRWGRSTLIAVAAINRACLGLAKYWIYTYTGYLVLEFFECLFGMAGFMGAYILMVELVVGPKSRVATGVTMLTGYAIGQASLGLIAWAIPKWKNLILAIYAPQLTGILYFWILTESVRWYMSKSRYEDAAKVLQKIARVNGIQLTMKALEDLKMKAEKEKSEHLEDGSEPLLIVLVFRYKPILLRCIVVPFFWVTVILIGFGLTINSVNISDNPYLSYGIIAVAEIPGFWLAFCLLNRIGRKPILMCGFWLCTVCQIAYIFIPKGFIGVSLTVYAMSKFSISAVSSSLNLYTSELFPTKHRHTLFSFCSMIGKLGIFVAPLTPAFGDKIPFIIFASFAFVAGFMVMLVPETYCTKFPDTMAEAVNMEKEN